VCTGTIGYEFDQRVYGEELARLDGAKVKP